jgi:hypothetical protein
VPEDVFRPVEAFFPEISIFRIIAEKLLTRNVNIA